MREACEPGPLAQRFADAVGGRLPSHARRLEWPAERLAAFQLERLRAMVAHAQEVSPWHRARLAGIDPARMSLDAFADVPPMSKADLLENWDGIVADPRLSLRVVEDHRARVEDGGPSYLFGEYRVLATSGSTGARAPYVWDFEGWTEYGAAGERTSLWAQKTFAAPPPATQAQVMAESLTHGSAAMFGSFPPGHGRYRFSAVVPIEETVAELNELAPEVVVSYPSALARLAREALAGRLRIHPLGVVAGAEPLEPALKDLIRAAFGVECANYYGSTEIGLIAGALPGAPMIVAEDQVFFEPVDAGMQRVPEGVRSHSAVATNLINRVVPLIRYVLGDSVTWAADDGAGPFCGRRLTKVEGRSDDFFSYERGVVVHPHAFRSALAKHEWVREYQVCQTRDGADVVVCAEAAGDTAPLGEEIERALRRAGMSAPRVRISVTDHIAPSASIGKVRRFRPLPSHGAAPAPAPAMSAASA